MTWSATLVGQVAGICARGTDPRDVLAALAPLVARSHRTSDFASGQARWAGGSGTTPSLLDPAMDQGPTSAVADRILDAVRRWRSGDVHVVTPGDPQWPSRVDLLARPPTFLAVRGTLSRDRPTVAIVGQRRATPYGREVASWLADTVARAGVVVVSGGAVGIDAAAHRATVDAGGRTLVVLGCGHDVAYPRPHATSGGLFDHVVDAGGALVSECLPGDPPRAHRVLARNRLVAAFADAVVVVEGGARSGTLNTATHAGEQGVTVLAVPGDIRAPGSAAPNQLLAEGCAPCRGPDDVLQAVGGAFRLHVVDAAGTSGSGPATSGPSALPPAVAAALAASFPRPLPMDRLAADSGTPAGSLLAAVTRARIAGEVAVDDAGIRLRRRPS